MNRKKWFLLIIGVVTAALAWAQPNCNVYTDGSPCRKACEFCYKAIDEDQGSRKSQLYFDSAIAICPTLAYAWFEKSVPYLKRGDFATWYKLLDKAVELEPNQYLGYRAGCLFPTLKDYKTVIRDLERLDKLRNGGALGYSPGGDYDLRIFLGLSRRESGDYEGALKELNKAIAQAEKENRVGAYDYIHRAVTYFQLKDYNAARNDLQQQLLIYPQLADTHYYLGLLAEASSNSIEAKRYYQLAYDKYLAGYHRHDPYSVLPDQVFLTQIKAKLGMK